MKTFSSFFLSVTTLFFFFFFFFFFSLSFQASLSQSLYSEIHQLISFKNVLPDMKLLPDWSSNKNPCTFNGVTCRDDKVTSIDLSSKPLNVGFSAVASSLMTITGLESLFLSNSHINGSISGFKCSASLTSLALSRNSLSGPVTTLTGLDVSRCVTLKFLHVSSNNFSIGIPFLEDCSALQHLDISGNKLPGDFHGTVPPFFSSCSLLESLVLSSRFQLQQFLRCIFPNLCRNPKNTLQEFNLHNNGFSNLVSLHLSFNYLSGTIPSSLGSLSKLQDLKLWLNMLEGEIPHENMLETLILDFNDLTGEIPSVRAVVFAFRRNVLNMHSQIMQHIFLDIPSLGFFTTYALLVLAWASIYCQARSISTDGLNFSFFTITGIVYVVQISLWLLWMWKPVGVMLILSKMFLAGVSLFVALGFLLHGARLFLMIHRFPVESKGRRKKLQEMCFAAFYEGANLDVMDHPILNLIYYLLVEIIPFSLVMFILRKLPPKRDITPEDLHES
ncbi:unnamed protein product [Arabidopsis arenosa]|uniref:Leucine-rich repeat-containing N-terminal plant-type domain-containing protein n=1 Tax=Arabidopsis arenosa TaxID=38785 RepID=A0A8S1ZJR2_ARAAE|nr:unnamed protein product [Arabidopsis arenosa]